MGGGFEQGAVYVPRFARAGVPVPAPDEDSFCMATAAIDSLPKGEGNSAVAFLHLVGEIPNGLDWGFAAYLGGPVGVIRHPSDVRGLTTAVRAATDAATDRSGVVIAVERIGPRGAQAVALRFGPRPVAKLALDFVPDGPESAGGAARAALEKLAGALTGGDPHPEAPWPSDRGDSFASLAPSQVSEGAYVPRPRYLENLPGRWRMEADRCSNCGRVTFPRRGRCRGCGLSDRLSSTRLPLAGAKVVAATVIGKGGQPTEFDAQVDALGGYAVVLAEFEPGVRLTLQLADATPGEVRIGDRIGTRLRRLYPMEGEWRYGRKAVPGAGGPGG